MTANPPGRVSILAKRTAGSGFLLSLTGGFVVYFLWGMGPAVSLTGTSLVVIVHLLWLDWLLADVLTGGAPRLRSRDGIKLTIHLLLLVALAAGASFWPRFSPAGSAAGVTVVIAALIFEGIRTPQSSIET